MRRIILSRGLSLAASRELISSILLNNSVNINLLIFSSSREMDSEWLLRSISGRRLFLFLLNVLKRSLTQLVVETHIAESRG